MNGLLSALARRRFLWPVGASFFRYGSGCRECVLFSAVEGGQTEWCICCSERFPRSVRSRTQPSRAESLVAGFGVRIPSSEEGASAEFAARESDGSPRNAMVFRTGVRQGLQRLCPAVCVFLTPLAPPKGGNYQSAVAGSGRTFERKARPARRLL